MYECGSAEVLCVETVAGFLISAFQKEYRSQLNFIKFHPDDVSIFP